MKLKAVVASLLLAALASIVPAQSDLEKAVKEIGDLNQRLTGFEALIEVHDVKADGEVVASSTLSVSKKHGWKMEDNSPEGAHIILNDFKTSFEYMPDQKKAFKLTADRPEIAAGFRKPANEINLIGVLDPKSLKLVGSEDVDGEPSYRFEGTTTTQFMEEGKPVTRRVEAWVGKKDGILRKTVEYTEETTGITTYRNVKANPEFKAADFQFEAPKGVEVIDVNAEMKKHEEGAAAGKKKGLK